MSVLARLLQGAVPARGPLRVLAVINAANSVGDGAFAAVTVVFLVRVVRLQPGSVTTGMAVAGALALLAGIPAGLLADRIGPPRVYQWLCVAEGVSVALYPLIRGLAPFVILVCLGTCADRATAGVRNGMIARVIEPSGRVAARAYLRSVTSTGTAVGAALGAVPLAVPSRLRMSGVFELDALSFVAAALVARRLHAGDEQPAGPGIVRGLLGDWSFLSASVLQALLSLNSVILTVALPLWIVTRTAAPAELIGGILVASTVGAVLLQVPVSRIVGTCCPTGRATWVAGVLVAAACLVLAVTPGRGALPVSLLLLTAAALRLAGDLLQSVAGWSMSAAAPPAGHESTYQSVYSSGFTLAAALGPALSGWAVTRPAGTGWLAAAGWFIAVGVLAACAGRRVMRRRAAGPARRAGHSPVRT